MEITIRPVDMSRWQDLTKLFGPSGIQRGCWCMGRRLSAKEFEANGNAENRAALKQLVRDCRPVGLVGYVADNPVTWCAVAPRPAYQPILRSRSLPIDEPNDESIWAITCLFTKAGFRKQRLTVPMIEAAVEYARSSGARIVEAYPVEGTIGDVSRGMLSTFVHTGFSVHAKDRTTSRRNVVVRRPL
jgi:GNAT superfamily N-acetyltransferase